MIKIDFKTILSPRNLIVALLIVSAIAVSLQSAVFSPSTITPEGYEYNRYNNYTIFKMSYHHLVNNLDLYQLHPTEHWDLYKYSPSFAVFFGFFAAFPDWLGLILWNLLNVIALATGVYLLPKLTNNQKGFILLISFIELLTSIQNHQSNGLMAGLILLMFVFLEKNKYLWATLFVVLSVYIKLFGIVGMAVMLFYPKKIKLAYYTLMWFLVILMVPLLFISIAQYQLLLTSFGNMLSSDHSISYGYSVMGWLHSWFGLEINKYYIVFIGALLFLLPFYRIECYKSYVFKLLALASVLIWVVIFNHKAESPTFIIAMAGVAIWFVISKKTPVNIGLFILAFILTSLSPTDLFPGYLRETWVIPYTLKAVPIIFIWFKIIMEMLTLKPDLTLQAYSSPPTSIS